MSEAWFTHGRTDTPEILHIGRRQKKTLVKIVPNEIQCIKKIHVPEIKKKTVT